jgi:hypothetical protein
MHFTGSLLNCTDTPTLCHAAISRLEFLLDIGRDFLLIIFTCIMGLSLITCLFHQFALPLLRKSFDVPTLQNLFLYALNFFTATAMLFLQVSVYNRIFFQDVVATQDKSAIVSSFTAFGLAFSTYAVELAFRPRMRGYLVIHHVLTNFFIFLGFPFAIDYVIDGYFVPYFRLAVLMGIQINTEQCIFVSMFIRVFAKRSETEASRKRLFWWSAVLMLVGVVQTVIFKVGAGIISMVIVLRDAILTENFFRRASGVSIFFAFFTLVNVVLLAGVQLYAAYVYFVIYRSTMKKYVDSCKGRAVEGGSPASVESPTRDPFGLLSPGSLSGSTIWDPSSPTLHAALPAALQERQVDQSPDASTELTMDDVTPNRQKLKRRVSIATESVCGSENQYQHSQEAESSSGSTPGVSHSAEEAGSNVMLRKVSFASTLWTGAHRSTDAEDE